MMSRLAQVRFGDASVGVAEAELFDVVLGTFVDQRRIENDEVEAEFLDFFKKIRLVGGETEVIEPRVVERRLYGDRRNVGGDGSRRPVSRGKERECRNRPQSRASCRPDSGSSP